MSELSGKARTVTVHPRILFDECRERLFWLLIANTKQTDSCWEWQGCKSLGYGKIRMTSAGRRTNFLAHRVAYALANGSFPSQHTDHLCRNRACVNPSHLEDVSRKTNILRGEGITAQNSKKTHCLKGHPLSGYNAMLIYDSWRHCRACAVARMKERRQRERLVRS